MRWLARHSTSLPGSGRRFVGCQPVTRASASTMPSTSRGGVAQRSAAGSRCTRLIVQMQSISSAVNTASAGARGASPRVAVQSEQAPGRHGVERQALRDAVPVPQPAVLDARPALEHAEELLDAPARLVAAHDALGRLRRRLPVARHQQPVQRLAAGRRARLPHLHHPGPAPAGSPGGSPAAAAPPARCATPSAPPASCGGTSRRARRCARRARA